MPFLLPLTLYSAVFFVFSLFFPPSSAVFYAAGALAVIAGICFVSPRRKILVVVMHAAFVAVASCVAAFGILSIVLFTWYASADHVQESSPTDSHWLVGLLSILIPMLLVRLVSMSTRSSLYAYGVLLSYAVLIGGSVALVEQMPVLRPIMGVCAIAGLIADRRFLTLALLEKRH